MVTYLLEKLGRIYAQKIAGYIAVLISMGIVRAVSYAVAKYPPLAPFINTPGLVESAMGITAAIINDLGNYVTAKNAGAAADIEAVAADLKTEQPVAKAEPVK